MSRSAVHSDSGATPQKPCYILRGPAPGASNRIIGQVEAEVLKLPRLVRPRLAEALIPSLDEDSEIEQAWEDEAERRYRCYLAGEEEAVPAAQALTEIRTELQR